MKRILLFLCSVSLLQSCVSLTALQAGDTAKPADRPQQLQAGQTHSMMSSSYPAVVVTPSGGHAVVMPPCGNTAVVVNPDGSHSIAVINGSTATIVTP